ncbi:hypothetical protein QR680_012104 [Steinernema hermaphroditum]|uniref:Serine/threonine-protein phosphatase n=1 Tax=Steinernema hermaphroditum TaxID=289476 RepID=A0AA39M067_9BILA|nr:hypothetical protein QR680_012104 [Steinernema hermaphroditum]
MAAEAETGWLNGVIEKLNGLYNRTDISICHVLSMDDIVAILTFSTKIIMQEGSLVEVEVPIKVIGDIHGQYQDMHKLFDLIGRVPNERMIFLGDYVDRGPQSLEVIVYLLALKLRYRDKIYLLRGNHETPAVNRIYGFYEECVRKYSVALWWEFQTVFNRLPMAGLISKKVLCMHGGLSPELTSLEQIRQIVRPCEPQDRGLLIDLLWSDPTNKGDGWFYSPRGISYAFGKGVMQAATKLLGVDMVIRAHQVVQDGYEVMVGRQLITIFSAPNYCGQFNNAAAVVCIDADLQVTFQQLRTNAPPNCNRPAPPVACELPYKPNSPLPTMKIGDGKTSLASPASPGSNESDKKSDKEQKTDPEKKAEKDENNNKSSCPSPNPTRRYLLYRCSFLYSDFISVPIKSGVMAPALKFDDGREQFYEIVHREVQQIEEQQRNVIKRLGDTQTLLSVFLTALILMAVYLTATVVYDFFRARTAKKMGDRLFPAEAAQNRGKKHTKKTNKRSKGGHRSETAKTSKKGKKTLKSGKTGKKGSTKKSKHRPKKSKSKHGGKKSKSSKTAKSLKKAQKKERGAPHKNLSVSTMSLPSSNVNLSRSDKEIREVKKPKLHKKTVSQQGVEIGKFPLHQNDMTRSTVDAPFINTQQDFNPPGRLDDAVINGGTMAATPVQPGSTTKPGPQLRTGADTVAINMSNMAAPGRLDDCLIRQQASAQLVPVNAGNNAK